MSLSPVSSTDTTAPAFLNAPASALGSKEIWTAFLRGETDPLNRAVAEVRASGGDLEDLIPPKHEINRQNESRARDTLLNWFSSRGDEEMVRLLLENGADPTTVKISGWTPLHSASKAGHTEVARLLLAHRADVNAKNTFGNAPLFYAFKRGHQELVQLLLENEADATNVVDRHDRTVLEWARLNGHQEIIDLLENSGSMSDET